MSLFLIVGHSFTPHCHHQHVICKSNSIHTHKATPSNFFALLYSPDIGEEHLHNFTEEESSVSSELQKVVKQTPSFTATFTDFSTAQNHTKQAAISSKNMYVCFFSHTIQDILFKNIPLRAPPVLA
ncbi:hypothetical protein Fleli_2149 [Bernardetia litoralis DSM 6794]|uniref:Uncharacterized protein n=2 Tax=Bernardetia litoralis TaxID=999 RepID=I4AKP4_BERLS|nr:hypothetical protein Fleli_2149 [Bernardetia litoralis DSM 6794]